MGANLITAARNEFARYQQYAERAFAQVDDREFFMASDSEANSIAVLAKHIGGNLRSRWTDFLISDGEKPDRHRDSEFEINERTARQDIVRVWDQGWRAVLETLDGLREEDLSRTILIRSEPHTVPDAILRSLAHTASHVGQIVLLAKQFRAADWKTLTIPRGRSEEFLQRMRVKFQ